MRTESIALEVKFQFLCYEVATLNIFYAYEFKSNLDTIIGVSITSILIFKFYVFHSMPEQTKCENNDNYEKVLGQMRS